MPTDYEQQEEKGTPAAGVETASVQGDLERIRERLDGIQLEIDRLMRELWLMVSK